MSSSYAASASPSNSPSSSSPVSALAEWNTAAVPAKSLDDSAKAELLRTDSSSSSLSGNPYYTNDPDSAVLMYKRKLYLYTSGAFTRLQHDLERRQNQATTN